MVLAEHELQLCTCSKKKLLRCLCSCRFCEGICAQDTSQGGGKGTRVRARAATSAAQPWVQRRSPYNPAWPSCYGPARCALAKALALSPVHSWTSSDPVFPFQGAVRGNRGRAHLRSNSTEAPPTAWCVFFVCFWKPWQERIMSIRGTPSAA